MPKVKRTRPDASAKCLCCKTQWRSVTSVVNLDAEVDELVTLCSGKLGLQLQSITDDDVRFQLKITQYQVHDKMGHLVRFDSDLIEHGIDLYLKGYVTSMVEDEDLSENIFPTKEIGPVIEWSITGFDYGDKAMIMLGTQSGIYYLMEPHPVYEPYVKEVATKAMLAKRVIEFLSISPDPSYIELLTSLILSTPSIEEPTLAQHAEFVVTQVDDIDDDGEMMATEAMQSICHLYNVIIKPARQRKPASRVQGFKKPVMTPTVKNHLKNFLKREKPETGCKIKNLHGQAVDRYFNPEIGDFVVYEEGFGEKRKGHSMKGPRDSKIFVVVGNINSVYFHGLLVLTAAETVLGSAGNPNELFYTETCYVYEKVNIAKKLSLTEIPPCRNWKDFINLTTPKVDGLFIRFTFSEGSGSFKSPPAMREGCPVCRKLKMKREEENSTRVESQNDLDNIERLVYDQVVYEVGCCVYIDPSAFSFPAEKVVPEEETNSVDDVLYPEAYRRKNLRSTKSAGEPFRIGHVVGIRRVARFDEKYMFRVEKFYRPENTPLIQNASDMHLLYWTDELVDVSCKYIRGRCHVVFSHSNPIDSIWETRFYFNSKYTGVLERLNAPPGVFNNEAPPKENVKRLAALNLFSGCGGFAQGLKDSKVADIKWAVEIDGETAEAFCQNHKEVTMFKRDASEFLRSVIAERANADAPQKGDVELLFAGPPCQGFSMLNRHQDSEHSLNKNAQILTYLSYCEYYRPKYIVMENVQNFVPFIQSNVFKGTLAALVAMGYQVAWGVCQAGSFGIAQSRRRLVVIGAASSVVELPAIPLPTHTFYNVRLETTVNEQTYSAVPGFDVSFYPKLWSAPLRSVTVADAIGDLVTPRHSSTSTYADYMHDAPFNDTEVKPTSILNQLRIRELPKDTNCDWRDLPNKIVTVPSAGLTVNKLVYLYDDPKNGKSQSGCLRGVCPCVSGEECRKDTQQQKNTLIPWELVHTANENNSWPGLYGRLTWSGAFGTCTTDPDPSSMQGRVIHPSEHRIVSVRECARAQGFTDRFKFQGTLAQKYRQVGNAVPPPLARAVGLSIKKSLEHQLGKDMADRN